MHDYHAISALVGRLTAEPDAGDVDEVRVRASPIFSPESLEQAYEMQTIDSPLAGSRLVVEEANEQRTCEACGTAWRLSRDDVAGHLVLCPSCGALTPIDESAGLELLEVRTVEAGRPRVDRVAVPRDPEPVGGGGICGPDENGHLDSRPC